MTNTKELLQLTVDTKASDLHIISGIAPSVRIDGELKPVNNVGVLTADMVGTLLKEVMNSEQLEKLNVNKEIDF